MRPGTHPACNWAGGQAREPWLSAHQQSLARSPHSWSQGQIFAGGTLGHPRLGQQAGSPQASQSPEAGIPVSGPDRPGLLESTDREHPVHRVQVQPGSK